MANHKGEPECVTCSEYEARGDRPFCKRYHSDLPTGLGPYLICRHWQGHDRKGLEAAWIERYLPNNNMLYQFDIYMGSEPKPIMQFAPGGGKK